MHCLVHMHGCWGRIGSVCFMQAHNDLGDEGQFAASRLLIAVHVADMPALQTSTLVDSAEGLRQSKCAAVLVERFALTGGLLIVRAASMRPAGVPA